MLNNIGTQEVNSLTQDQNEMALLSASSSSPDLVLA
jgi:hypothetical protein